MLQSTLSSIREILKAKAKLSNEKTEELLSILSMYNEKDIIYPGVLIRKLNISMKETYSLLEKIKEDGHLSLNYEMYCFSCNQFTGDIFQTIGQIPEEIFCENCGEELTPIDNSIAIYKVKYVK